MFYLNYFYYNVQSQYVSHIKEFTLFSIDMIKINEISVPYFLWIIYSIDTASETYAVLSDSVVQLTLMQAYAIEHVVAVMDRASDL